MQKGKLIIKATQKRIFEDTEENFEVNEVYEEEEEDDDVIKMNEPITEINESKKIFEFKKFVVISNKDYLEKGKYSFPFEVELPQNISGSFVFLQNKTYAEIIYSIKVNLNNTNIKERIPIIIRQKKELFNYPKNSEYTRKIPGWCCEVGESNIKLNMDEDYIVNGNDIQLNVNINNTKSKNSGSPLNIEIYQSLILKNNKKNKKIKITNIVGKYKGKKMINAGEDFKKEVTISLYNNKYISEHLSETKSKKCFRHETVIPLLNQSIKSDYITNEYEIYEESQFSNLSTEELGVFLKVLIYPPEKEILSKTIAKIAKEFINKKIFLNSNALDNDLEDNNKNNKKEFDSYEESLIDEKSKKSEKIKSNIKVKIIKKIDEDIIENNINNNENEKNKISYNENNEDIKNKIIKKSKGNNNNFNENFYLYENNINNNDIIIKKSNIMTDEISFGTSTKDKLNLFNLDTASNNIKKILIIIFLMMF